MASRNFVNRRHGVMKKANTLHRLHGARIAVLLEWNDTIYSYRSDAAWPSVDLDIEPSNTFSPDHFETVADRSSPPARAHSNSLPPTIVSETSTNSDSRISQSDSTTDCGYVTVADAELQALVALESMASNPASSHSWSEGSTTVSTAPSPFSIQNHPTLESSAVISHGTKRDAAGWTSPALSGVASTDYLEKSPKRPRRLPARMVRNKRGPQPSQPKEYF